MKKMQNILNKYLILFFILGAFFCANKVSASTLYAGSANQTVYNGQTFVVEWYFNSDNHAVNVVNLGVLYSTSTLKIVDISTAGSDVSLWVKNPKETSGGVITAVGGIPTGLSNPHISLFRTTFLALKSGVAVFDIVSGSQTLRNDGVGTSEIIHFTPITFTVLDSQNKQNITSPTNPNQQNWYHNKNVTLVFETEKNTEYSYSFSVNPEIFPTKIATTTNGTVSYSNLNDGLYYFKLASRKTGGEWQDDGVFRVQIDKTNPEDFTPVLTSDKNIFNGKTFLVFNTNDKTSGLNYFEIKAGLFGFYHEIKSPYKISRPWIGAGVTIRAFDSAGNYSDKFVAYPGYISTNIFVVLVLIIIMCATVYKRFYYLVYNKTHKRS